ncbi:MAG TPA: AIR synthase-related protein, partial [bacterium]|nr:AIR synthase-related protein [bacterium]
ETAFAGGLGAAVSLQAMVRRSELQRSDWALFAESNSRFVVEVIPANEAAFRTAFAGLPCALIGEVTAAPRLQIRGLTDEPLVDEPIDTLKRSWQETLRW